MKNNSFIDEVEIKIKAGNGGDGSLAFHREKYIEYGGPSGGNGGDGGSIFFVADHNENNLLKFKNQKKFFGEDGGKGQNKNRTGKKGKDIFVSVPIGTEVILENKVHDLNFEGKIIELAKGGRGGRGNASFKSSKNTAPTLFEKGEKTDWIDVKLNLKILADVGVVGYPNIGKSTFVSTISNSKTEINNYEFTTINPQVGAVKYKNNDFLIADLPGLIEGASENKGMGIKFLKHISRIKIVLHFIDSSNLDWKNNYLIIKNELKKFSKEIYEKEEIIVFSKCDLLDEEIKKWILKEFNKKDLFFISSFTKEGIDLLLDNIIKKLSIIREEEKLNSEKNNYKDDEYVVIKLKENEKNDYKIYKEDNTWTIKGNYPKYWANRIPLISRENYHRILSKFKSKGIIDELQKKGIKKGDIIIVSETNFVILYEDFF